MLSNCRGIDLRTKGKEMNVWICVVLIWLRIEILRNVLFFFNEYDIKFLYLNAREEFESDLKLVGEFERKYARN